MTELEKTIAKIYANGRRETFEDGVESEFSIALIALVKEHKAEVLRILTSYVDDQYVNMEVFSEGLGWIGYMDDENELGIWKERRLFLEYCLLNSLWARVKDGAGLGLASMDDPASIPALRIAVNRESEPRWGPSLKENLQQVLDQLIETQESKRKDES